MLESSRLRNHRPIGRCSTTHIKPSSRLWTGRLGTSGEQDVRGQVVQEPYSLGFKTGATGSIRNGAFAWIGDLVSGGFVRRRQRRQP
jgi:hypothetical protein